MSLEEDLLVLKNQSIESDHMKAAGSLFADLEAMGQKIAASIIKQLDKPRINNEAVSQDERVSAMEAMKKIEVEAKVNRIISKYAKAIMPIRDEYYRSRMFKLGAMWEQNLQEDLGKFTTFKVKFTKREISTITDFIESVQIKDHLKNLRAKTNFRLNQIIKESYKEMPQVKKVYRETYKEKLKGAMRGLNMSFRGITNGLFTEVFEQAQSRWMGAINGI